MTLPNRFSLLNMPDDHCIRVVRRLGCTLTIKKVIAAACPVQGSDQRRHGRRIDRSANPHPAAGCELNDLYLDQQAIDTTTPMSKLMFQVTGAFAEFERSLIKQGIHAGCREQGPMARRLGSP